MLSHQYKHFKHQRKECRVKRVNYRLEFTLNTTGILNIELNKKRCRRYEKFARKNI